MKDRYERKRDEIAWLVESPQRVRLAEGNQSTETPAQYLGVAGRHGWMWHYTVDHAIRFARKEDAERVARAIFPNDLLKATEHVWTDVADRV